MSRPWYVRFAHRVEMYAERRKEHNEALADMRAEAARLMCAVELFQDAQRMDNPKEMQRRMSEMFSASRQLDKAFGRLLKVEQQ